MRINHFLPWLGPNKHYHRLHSRHHILHHRRLTLLSCLSDSYIDTSFKKNFRTVSSGLSHKARTLLEKREITITDSQFKILSNIMGVFQSKYSFKNRNRRPSQVLPRKLKKRKLRRRGSSSSSLREIVKDINAFLRTSDSLTISKSV